jgi:hypothetical protein
MLTAGLSATTQYLAWSYRFAPTLGAPWLRGTGLPYGDMRAVNRTGTGRGNQIAPT